MLRRIHTSIILALLALLAACGGATPAPRPTPTPVVATTRAEPELIAIDIYGTSQLTLEQLMATHGDYLRAFGEGLMMDTPDVDMEGLISTLGALGDFADISPALVGYYEPGGMKYYLTIDFVDRTDAARRMPFAPEPTGSYEDPEGLLADWHAYETKLGDLMASGAMSPRRVDCPAFHCVGDYTNPEVKALAARFAERVPAHVNELAMILRDDHVERHRAAAAFLLAYSKDGPALVKLMLPAFRDPSSGVRNNAMRVIADIAHHHPELEVPREPVLEALNYPATLDRNKSAAILDVLLKQPGAAAKHHAVAVRAGATLLAMLRLQQPNNHDFAYSILKTISGRTFGERDYAAWEDWLTSIGGSP